MTLSHTMLAIEITAPGGPEVLQPVTLPVPVPGHGQIIVRLAWAGVNRPDALQRAGLYAPPASASPLPGLEGAGTVVETGPGVTRWKIGDKVCALFPGGAYAEYAACHEAHALPVPEGLTLREAACLPETCFTVWSNIVMRGGLKAGERFLVHGGTYVDPEAKVLGTVRAGDRLQLVPEPHNVADPLAILVWPGRPGATGCVGYVPGPLAPFVHSLWDQGIDPEVTAETINMPDAPLASNQTRLLARLEATVGKDFDVMAALSPERVVMSNHDRVR